MGSWHGDWQQEYENGANLDQPVWSSIQIFGGGGGSVYSRLLVK